jgi:hypothetical protein
MIQTLPMKRGGRMLSPMMLIETKEKHDFDLRRILKELGV